MLKRHKYGDRVVRMEIINVSISRPPPKTSLLLGLRYFLRNAPDQDIFEGLS
jgi:hypothetical protein